MRRIAVIGCGGAGKSTLSRELGRRLDLPVVHLDTHYWNAGWIATPRERWRLVHHELIAAERWIIDGNFADTMEARLSRADTALFLDYPRRVCLTRIARRVVRYRGRTRPDLPDGCPEGVDLEFLRWVFRYRRDVRPGVLALLERAAPHVRVEVFPTPGALRRFLDRLDGRALDRRAVR